MQHQGKNYINGAWIAPAAGEQTLDVINPFTEQVIGKCADSAKADVDAAAKAAKDASVAWNKTTGAHRAGFLKAFAKEVLARKQELSELETIDNGKPFPESEWDMDDVAACFEYYATKAIELDAKQMTPVDVGDDEFKACLRYEPAGVAAAIIPWNYPLLMAAWKVCPALAAGCTIVLKPSELTPMTALVLGEIASKVQLPPGVLNIVFGTGVNVGAPLVQHPLINKVAFTGSVPTGMNVMKGCVDDLKNVTLELGGKSPSIVFQDADLVTAVEWVMFGCFWTNGQICSATSRLLIHESIAEKFLQLLVENTKNIKMGDPMDNDCRLGPVVSKAQQLRILGFVDQAKQEGAQVVLGGGAQDKEALPTGFFVQPTILKVTKDMTIWKEEVFGPVLSFMTFSTEEEAITLANDCKYGLGCALFTQDQQRFDRVTPAMECGMVWQNCSQPCFCQLPWGGVKHTGIGRELGEFGLHNYLQPKQVVQRVCKDPLGWYPITSNM